MKKYKAKGGVYCIHFPIDKIQYPEFMILKKGHSKSLSKRFSTYNTSVSFPANKVENHLKYVLHSPENAFSGTSIMESIVHNFFSKHRINPKKEFFKFDNTFNINTFFPGLKHEFELRNIRDISLYENYEEVPYTKIPDGYVQKIPKIKNTFEPRNYQEPIIQKIITHYQENDKGGLYLPPGYGKTYIAVLALNNTEMATILVLTPRLSICTEWEKCFSYTDFPVYMINSESTDVFPELREKSVVISTYQSYLKNPQLYKDYGIIIYDEAHHLMTDNEFSKSLDISGKKLFLTATPILHYFDEDKDNMITQELNVEKYGKTIYTASLHDSIDNGILCDYRLLVHNKPSCVDCTEHVQDLVQIYGRKKFVVFYNTIEKAGNAYEILKGKYSDVYYIDSKTKKKDRNTIFQKFEKAETGIIVNIDVLSEGVSIPCIDCILLMEPRFSQRVLIQILGRGLRVYTGKQNCVFCLPVDCQDTLELCLTSLIYDNKGDKGVKNRILTEVKTLMERDEIIKNTETKLKLIEISRKGFVPADYKIKLLSDIVENDGKLVSQRFNTNDGILLGQFQNTIIGTLSGVRNRNLEHMERWRLQYKNLFKLLDERVKNIREKREIKVNVNQDDRIKMLNDIVVQEEKLVLKSYKTPEGIKLGTFQDNILTTLSGNGTAYKKYIPGWYEKYPVLFGLLHDRVVIIKDRKKSL